MDGQTSTSHSEATRPSSGRRDGALGRGRLTDQAYGYVRDGIQRGTIPTGSVLAEAGIARTLGISRTPVRHALSLLLREGLVELGPRRQATVRGFTPAHREEILLLRRALEGIAVRRACGTATDDDLDELRLLLLRQRRAARDGDEDRFLDLDEAFHLRIAGAARLPILSSLLGQLRDFVRVARLGLPRPAGVLEQVCGEHERIVDALERRSPAEALDALVEHLERSDYSINEEENR